MRGFYVERCYLSNFTGSFVYLEQSHGSGRMVMHAQDNQQLEAFDSVPSNGAAQTQDSGDALIEPAGKGKLAREQNKS